METWQPVLPKYISSGKPFFFEKYFWLIGLEVVLTLIGDHLLCWFFLWMLKVGAGSPFFFFRTSKRLIEEQLRNFRGFEGRKWTRQRPTKTHGMLFTVYIVASRSTSRLVSCLGLFRLLMKGIFSPYVLWPLDKKLIFWIVTRVSPRDYTVISMRA